MHRRDFNSVEIISSFTHWIHGCFSVFFNGIILDAELTSEN